MYRLRLLLPILRTLLILTLLSIAVTAQAATPKVQTIWQLLDYLAVDYAGAVDDGQVINAFEYAEMQEFSANISERLAELPGHPQQAELLKAAGALQQLVNEKSAPATVAQQARSLAEDLLQAYPVPRAPQELPDLSQAAALYQHHCASCHGVAGGGDGPQSVGMDPPPIAFTDLERARQRSLFALQQVIEQGLEGTAMTSYAHLPEAQRWALAFYIGQFAFDQKMAEHGEKLWRDQPALQAALPDPGALIQAQPANLAGLSGDAADALNAYLRRHPERLINAVQDAVVGNNASLALARTRLQQTVDAYANGQLKQARDMALSAYLDGVEPIEPLLRARDLELLADVVGQMHETGQRIGKAGMTHQQQLQWKSQQVRVSGWNLDGSISLHSKLVTAQLCIARYMPRIDFRHRTAQVQPGQIGVSARLPHKCRQCREIKTQRMGQTGEDAWLGGVHGIPGGSCADQALTTDPDYIARQAA